MDSITNQSMFLYQSQYHTETSTIRLYGLEPTCEPNKEYRSIFVLISDFTPYIYVELPTIIIWTQRAITILMEHLKNLLSVNEHFVISKLVYRKRLYYAHLDKDNKPKIFPYLLLAFESQSHIRNFLFKINKPILLKTLHSQSFKLKCHEQDACPTLQLTVQRKLPRIGFVQFDGLLVVNDAKKISFADVEFRVRWKNIRPCENDINFIVPVPRVMFFDLEIYSSDSTRMPDSNVPDDKIFQISCIFTSASQEKKEDRVLLSLGLPSQSIVGEDVTIIYCSTESNLLRKYVELVRTRNPQVVVGYNTFQFDIPYMIQRAKMLFMYSGDFDTLGMMKEERGRLLNIKWSSSAFKNQEFNILDMEGRVQIDLLCLVRRDFNLNNYKLNTVSEHILGDCKDDLDYKNIFKCYEVFTSESLGKVGKYCIQDSVLLVKLVQHMQTWIGLCEMAKTCLVQIFDLYTRGQQIRVFSQVYAMCIDDGFVVEKDGYIAKETDHFEGAIVLEPIPGLYEYIVPFDFSSLYPSLIIRYNIDFSTLVHENDTTIKDDQCHVIEWETHEGCKHDNSTNTKKKTSICNKYKFRFLKSSIGLLPKIVDKLLKARKDTRRELSALKKNDPLYIILDKRQLAYKISANSVYGALGARKGYLPFLPGAMSITAAGRMSLMKAIDLLSNNYSAKVVYGDTDSVMVSFEGLDNAKDVWKHALEIENTINTHFVSPMKLSFEEKIYLRFFILTKKRYLALECDATGVVNSKIYKKGVLLCRRDNSKIGKDIYADIVMQIFHKSNLNDVVWSISNWFLHLACTSKTSEFIITKSIGNVTNYKVRNLPTDASKRVKYLQNISSTEENYAIRTLPAHIQLAEKMRQRGTPIAVGSRMEYVITLNAESKDSAKYNSNKQQLFRKIEHVDYFNENKDVLQIDHYYYMKLLSTPIDEALYIAFGVEKICEKLTKTHILKYNLNSEFKALMRPTINI